MFLIKSKAQLEKYPQVEAKSEKQIREQIRKECLLINTFCSYSIWKFKSVFHHLFRLFFIKFVCLNENKKEEEKRRKMHQQTVLLTFQANCHFLLVFRRSIVTVYASFLALYKPKASKKPHERVMQNWNATSFKSLATPKKKRKEGKGKERSWQTDKWETKDQTKMIVIYDFGRLG